MIFKIFGSEVQGFLRMRLDPEDGLRREAREVGVVEEKCTGRSLWLVRCLERVVVMV